MPAVSGPAMALVALLLIAGVQKVVDPSSTSGALRAARLPSRPGLVRLLGGVEAGVAGWWLVAGGPLPAILAAAFYAGFAWFVINALVRKLPISSCGCLGSTETPPTVVHVIMNVTAVAVLLVAAMTPVAPLGGLAGVEWGVAVPYLLLVGASVYMLYAMLTVLPLVSRTRRGDSTTMLPDPARVMR